MNTTRALALFLALALLALLFLALSVPTARAADPVILRVTTTGTTMWPCGDQADWSNACALQTALTRSVSGAEVWVAAGTYTPTTGTDRTISFRLREGVALYGGFAMTETLRSQRNFTANVTILSGDIGAQGNNMDNSYNVVTTSRTTGTVLDGFTVTGGKAVGGSYCGGGMYNEGSNPTVANVTFSGNSGSSGGGMCSMDLSYPTLTNTTFLSNTATNQGGGMYNQYYSFAMLTNVTFVGNTAYYGGGMYNSYSNPVLVNVTFSDNDANYGGGMRNWYNTSPLLRNVTFSGNSATVSGGGISNENNSSPTIGHAVFWGNTAPNDSQIYNDGSSTANIYDSVVQGGYAGGTSIITADPRLGALGDWGGSTRTFPLLPGSSAIDAGDDMNCPPTDQRGIPRPQGTHCDIGAYESRGFGLAKGDLSGDNQSTIVTHPFANPLRVTVSSAYGEPVDNGAVTFTAPSSGATTTPTTNTATIASGAVTQTLTANGIVGSYWVAANSSGATALAMFNLINIKTDTTTTLTSSANPSFRGQSVTFTATVSGASPGGSVAFKDGGATLAGCGNVSLSGGSAQCTVSSLALGTHDITAAYSGDANNNASTSAIYTQTAYWLEYYLPLIRK